MRALADSLATMAPPPPPCPTALTDAISAGAAFTDAISAGAALCATDSGYSFSTMLTAPSPDEVAKICASTNCVKMLDSMQKASPHECTLTRGFELYQEIMNPIIWVCPSANIKSPSTESGDMMSTASSAASVHTASTYRFAAVTAGVLALSYGVLG